MVKVKDLSKSALNYAGSSSRASTAYKDKVLTVGDWQSKAASDHAETNYDTAIADAIARKLRQKALQKVTNDKWQSRASTVGATNISAGIARSGPQWQTGFSPYSSVLNSTTLLDRTLDASQNIDNRVKGVDLPLAAKKKELKGA